MENTNYYKLVFSCKAEHPGMRVFLVTWQRWQSYHSIGHSWKPYDACKVHSSTFYRTGVIANWLSVRLHIAGIQNFMFFAAVTLTVTFLYELADRRHPLKMYLWAENALFTSRLSKIIVLHTYRHTDIQTHRHTDTQTYRHVLPKLLPRHFVGGRNCGRTLWKIVLTHFSYWEITM